MTVISTEEGGAGDDGARLKVGTATAGNSLSSNKRQLLVSVCGSAGGLFGGVDVSLSGNGDAGVANGDTDETKEGVRGVASLRAVARGDDLELGVFAWDANLQGGT